VAPGPARKPLINTNSHEWGVSISVYSCPFGSLLRLPAAGSRLGFVQLKADTIVQDALRPTVGVRQELDRVRAADQESSVEGEVLFDPVGANSVALHGAGGRQSAGVADGLA